MDADAIWAAGDHASYRIESNASGTLRTWTLGLTRLSVPEPSENALWAPDPECGFVRTRRGRVSYQHPDHGPTPFLTEYQSKESAPVRLDLTRGDDPEVHSTTVLHRSAVHVSQNGVESFRGYGLNDLLRLLLGVEPLFEELLSVIQTPSAWSFLTNGFGVRIRLVIDSAEVTQTTVVQTPLGELPAFWLPGTLYANDQEALRCRFLITWRRSPLLLSMGVLRIEGHHPRDEARRVTASLLAARRGEEQRPDPDDFGDGLRRGMTRPEVFAAWGLAPDSDLPTSRWTKADSSGASDGAVGRAAMVMHRIELPSSERALGRIIVFHRDALCFLGFPNTVKEFLERRGFKRVDSKASTPPESKRK